MLYFDPSISLLVIPLFPFTFSRFDFDADLPCHRLTKAATKSQVFHGVVPHDHWHQPDWIDEEKATAGRNKLVSQNIIYGGKYPFFLTCSLPSFASFRLLTF
jgi:hypothetical protein